MARIKYYYDTESCRYERIKVTSWDIFWNFLGFLTLALSLAFGIFFIYTIYFESPEEAILRKENEELRMYYELISKEVEDANEMLSVLQERDDNVYRVIMGAEPIPDEIRTAGVGGSNRYRKILEQGLEREDLVVSNYKRIDQLKKQMYIQTKSYDEVMKLALNKEKMLASLPAILPVAKENLYRLSSDFGYRMDPILKIKRFHDGVDFSLPKGTPVYATGDGKVKYVFSKNTITGYGKQVEIDHGFGYITKYAHLSEILVKEGQNIKRGDMIAYSGHTGKSTAPHLHYEVRIDKKTVNPAHYFYMGLTPEEYQDVLRLASNGNQAMDSH